MQNINPELLRASKDLGANSFKTTLKIIMPLCKGGLYPVFYSVLSLPPEIM